MEEFFDAFYCGISYDAAQQLLKSFPANTKNEKGQTVLFSLAEKGATQMGIKDLERVVALLVRSGCDLNATDEYETTALSSALALGRYAYVGVLIDAGAAVDKSAILDAVISVGESEDEQKVCALLEKLVARGADVNAITGEQARFSEATALHYAAAAGLALIVEQLLSLGADPSALCNAGEEPSIRARDEGHLPLAHRIWREKKLQCDKCCKWLPDDTLECCGQSEAQLATYSLESWCRDMPTEAKIRHCLERGAVVKGGAALHKLASSGARWCSDHEASSILHILLEAGADLEGEDSSGQTCLRAGLETMSSPLFCLSLLDKGCSVREDDVIFSLAQISETVDEKSLLLLIERLVERGAKVGCVDEESDMKDSDLADAAGFGNVAKYLTERNQI